MWLCMCSSCRAQKWQVDYTADDLLAEMLALTIYRAVLLIGTLGIAGAGQVVAGRL